MSLSISLRRSPKPGALTAHHVQGAAQLVHHQGGQRLAVDVLGDDEQRLARLGDLLEHGQKILHVRDLLLVDEDVRILQHDFHALGIGHEVGRQVAAVELHALDHVQRGLHRLGFLDGDDAFLADLLHGLGQDVADHGVAVGADGADLGDLGLALGGLGLLFQVLDHLGHGGVDAALDVHRVVAGRDQLAPSLKMACASTVAVVVPSPATSEVLEATSLTIWAPMLAILSASSTSLATVTPSLVTVGEPHDFSMMTLRPRGPSVTLTVLARRLSPCAMAWRAG
jgi:hypothetical protein